MEMYKVWESPGNNIFNREARGEHCQLLRPAARGVSDIGQGTP